MLQVKKNQNTDRLIDTVIDFVIKTGCRLSKDALEVLLKEHGGEIFMAALPITIKDIFPCPPGMIRDPRSGQCVTDPGK